MQMNVDVNAQTIDPLMFFLTGKQPGSVKDALAGKRPVLLAAYRDPTRLRYDFPLVLVEGKTDVVPVRSLSSVIDMLLQKVAPPGAESEQLRKMILRIEREIRTLSMSGAEGSLSELWNKVATRLEDADAGFGKSVRIARAALEVDGAVIDCRADAASRVVVHLWAAVEERKAQAFRAVASRLAIKLADILRADYLRSSAGRSADNLAGAVGPLHQALFDFAAMSQLLPKPSPREALSETRRHRVKSALEVIKQQRFFAPAAGQARPDHAQGPYSFRFDNCADAIAAYRARLPELVKLVKAMSIAELEIDGTYVESKHDVIFSGFDAGSLSPRDQELFPDYLVAVSAFDPALDNASVMTALSSGAPLKVFLNVGDLFEEAPAGDGLGGLRAAQLATLAAGLGEVFVLQSASSNFYQVRDRIERGLSFNGPALFSVFCGVPEEESGLPLYLSAAAAMQSRAFPAFSYDPAAGADLASRFSLENNPKPEADWTVQTIEYADPDMQRVTQEVAFTFVDFLLCDPRHHGHFVAAPRGFAKERMVPAALWISQAAAESSDSVPYVITADRDNALSSVIVDDRAIGAARRCLESWRRLQESGGIHNSHAERLLKREREFWEDQKRQELAAMQLAAVPAVAALPSAPRQPAAPAAEATAAAAPERNPDEAYIETERCSSCNECTQINDRMFAYNGDKQAYIADLKAGSYAQLVEAAESCQLAIIHPGKPINPAEPGLDDLLKRAQPFR